MATIGQLLTSPENGWRRYNDDFAGIVYSDTLWNIAVVNDCYCGQIKYAPESVKTGYFEFTFYGNKLRFCQSAGTIFATNTEVFIDGISCGYLQTRAISGTCTRQVLVFEKTDLEDGIHTVRVVCGTDGSYGLECDAIDINENGHICNDECNHTEIPNISNKNASLTYTLPMATTKKIKAKSNDKRVGLLGLANDDENFGDLYVVGKDGKSHLTKSGIKSEILFDGKVTSPSTINITKELKEFKLLIFETTNSSDGERRSYNTIYVSEKLFEIKQILLHEYGNRYTSVNLTDDKLVLSISALRDLHLRRIIGIY